ncbi:MAG: hypothetical protein RML45_10720 [Acetobacteraceae bacterium]|nr:hypothetical protein [Acetobacteraceae bacterium]
MSRIVKVVLVAGGLAAAGLAGYGAGRIGAWAQPGMGPGMGQGPGMMAERGPGPRWDGQGPRWDGPRGAWQREPHRGGLLRGFFINRDNKNLSDEEVRKIAEAALLWLGERNWRIGEVKALGAREAEIAVTTAEGGVIARFVMHRDTGRVRRIG